MRPQLLKVNKEPGQSFTVRRDLVPSVNDRWHFHPELELIHIKEGRGMQFIGDHSKSFQPGDVVLVGASLPHCLQFDGSFEKADVVSPISVPIPFAGSSNPGRARPIRDS